MVSSPVQIPNLKLKYSPPETQVRETSSQTYRWVSTNNPEYREAFALFDKRGTGQVPRESLGELLRSLGQNPTQAEVNDLERQVGGTCTYCIIDP
jgi:Ca2+-binding EF-hand superfamily protein